MEIVIIAAIAIGIVGWWIWKEGKHEENGHPLENVTQRAVVAPPVVQEAVEPVAVEAAPAKKAKKAAALKKAAAPKKEKAPAPKKAPAKKTAAAKKSKAK
jgi:hypothetical protein